MRLTTRLVALSAVFIPCAALCQEPPKTTTRQPEPIAGAPIQASSLRNQRKAAKLYLEGAKLLEKQQPEAAWALLKQAVELEPGNLTYSAASELARQSAVSQLVQMANQQANQLANPEAAKLLRHALDIDPTSETAIARLNQLGDQAITSPVGTTASSVLADLNTPRVELADSILLQPDLTTAGGRHTFHLRSNAAQAVKDVFKAYGLEATVHSSVSAKPIRMDVENATFPEAMRILGLLTHTFYEPLDPHRVLVAQDTRENRTQFQRLEMETIYLPGLTDTELTDMSNLARNVFQAQQAVVEPTTDTLTIRAAPKTLTAFNSTLTQLLSGRSQVDLNVKIIQLAHINSRETGTTAFQQTKVANAYTEIASVISQNQSLVQQVISSGLVPDANTLAHQIEIVAILIGSGQLTGTIFNQGFATFGGGLAESILAPGPGTLTMTLNSSDTRALDDVHMRLSDQEAGTFKSGVRYPIVTSSYSSVALPAAVTALTGGALSSQQTIPQIQYQDLGLTLKATPKIMRSDDVALTLELKIDALGGSSLNDIPILDSRQISGVLTLKAGETVVLLSNLSRQQSRALSGLPGVSDIPGFKDISDISRSQNVARLLILITPNVVRGPQLLARGPRFMMDKSQGAR